MDIMKIAGIVFIIIGLLMFILNKPIGHIFSQLGEIVFKDSPFKEFTNIYKDHSSVVLGIKILGCVSFVLGVLFYFIVPLF